MKGTLIRYKAKPENVEENIRLIQGVFEELAAKSPAGIRYMALKLSDGSFVHFKVDTAEGADPIHDLQAFQAFQSGIQTRCAELPQAKDATIIGSYQMLSE